MTDHFAMFSSRHSFLVPKIRTSLEIDYYKKGEKLYRPLLFYLHIKNVNFTFNKRHLVGSTQSITPLAHVILI